MYKNKAAIEGAGGASLFISFVYWSSSVYGGNSNNRCILNFNGGNFGYHDTSGNDNVRCVRDI